jgi:hypothetical protein
MVIPGYHMGPETSDMLEHDDPVGELSLGFWCQYALKFVSMFPNSSDRWEEYGPTD